MQGKLPRRYQVHKEVARNGYFEGEIALAAMSRLIEFLYPESSTWQQNNVLLKFEFTRNAFDIPIVSGRLETCLELECQRCLGRMQLSVAQDFRLMIDASDELVGESSMDTLYSEDGYVDINEVVEDELILAIPLVAMHEDESCNEHWQASDEERSLSNNPFAVLQQLKTTD